MKSLFILYSALFILKSGHLSTTILSDMLGSDLISPVPGIFVSFKQVSHTVLVFPLLTLHK